MTPLKTTVWEANRGLAFKRKTPVGGHSLIWRKWVCAAQQGMVFRVLRLKRGIHFHYLTS